MPLVVIGEIITEKPFEMAFVEDDDVIQTLPAHVTNDALGIGILPRTPRRGRAFLHPQTAHAFSKLASVATVRACAPDSLRQGLAYRKRHRCPFSKLHPPHKTCNFCLIGQAPDIDVRVRLRHYRMPEHRAPNLADKVLRRDRFGRHSDPRIRCRFRDLSNFLCELGLLCRGRRCKTNRQEQGHKQHRYTLDRGLSSFRSSCLLH